MAVKYTRKQLKEVRTYLRKAMRHQMKVWFRTNQMIQVVHNLDHATVARLVQLYAEEGKPTEITLEDVASLLHESEV